jgi:hypothetical protein
VAVGHDIARLGRLTGALWKLLGDDTTVEGSSREVRRLLNAREEGFLATVRGIYARPASPYARLLAHAGIEEGDVAALVHEQGLEGALGRLHDAGVYTTSAELKGDEPIRRGSLELHARYEDFANPQARAHVVLRSGGSGGRPRHTAGTLAATEHSSLYVRLFLDAYSLAPRPMALWYPSPPGQAGFGQAIQHLRAGWDVERWFAQTPWLQRGLAQSSLTTLAAFAAAPARRKRLAFPRLTPPEEAGSVARWAAAHARAGRPAYLAATPSSAVRVVRAARELGLDVAGTMFRCGGEPLTAARAQAIADAGGRSASFYFAAEASSLVGAPCADGVAADDLHSARTSSRCSSARAPCPTARRSTRSS